MLEWLNMFHLPKIEKITRDATVSHFFLMFGYKLFSLYFPLFLIAKNFSILQVGYTNFLIYLPIAVFAPIAGFLNHRINPAILASVGIAGYGVYSLGMIVFPNLAVFYLLQIILGISAALFFVSSRAILMGSNLDNPDRAFGWFYSAPSYADAVAPAVGAFFIWRFGFLGVFILSVILQILNAIFCFSNLRDKTKQLTEDIKIKDSGRNYLEVLKSVKGKDFLPLVLASFLVLVLAGFNNTFFVLFLKGLGWSQNQILIFSSLLSLIFLPISFWVIGKIAKRSSAANISYGSQISGVFSAMLGGLAGILNFYYIFFIMIGKYAGGLMAGAGRSGIMATKLKKYPEESAAVDTMFAPLATAAGAIIGGLLIGMVGYQAIFIAGGILLFIFGRFAKRAVLR